MATKTLYRPLGSPLPICGGGRGGAFGAMTTRFRHCERPNKPKPRAKRRGGNPRRSVVARRNRLGSARGRFRKASEIPRLARKDLLGQIAEPAGSVEIASADFVNLAMTGPLRLSSAQASTELRTGKGSYSWQYLMNLRHAHGHKSPW